MKHTKLGNYNVWDNGTITSKYGWRGKIDNQITPVTDAFGYQCVRLVIDGKRKKWKLHKLIAELFLDKPENPKAIVCHKDGDKTNNRASNLYYGDAKSNAKDRDIHGKTSKGAKHSKRIREGIAQSKLNAHLIAAAPEMLEVLEKIGREVSKLDAEFKDGFSWTHLNLVREAIRKAKGGA